VKTYVGVDIGGTNIRYGLVNAEGDVLADMHFPIRSERGREVVLNELCARLAEFIDSLPPDLKPSGIGLGTAGRVIPEEGLVVFSPNIPIWRNLRLGSYLKERLGLPVRMENDANLFALGEWLAGAGRGLNHVLGVTLGTGVGGGLILSGHIWNGAFGTAAEIGHCVVEPEGRPCRCGGRGCLETLASATAMAEMARERILAGRACGYQGPLEQLTSAHLFDLARQGDELALEIFRIAGEALGLTLVNVFNLLGLEGVVIGGGAGMTFEFLKPHIMKTITGRLFTMDVDQLFLARSSLGDLAPLIGAAALFK
jgi:glucokinase